jgi:replicative DNA helicase
MDLDMEGGVRRSGESAGGRLFTLAARTGVGKTVLGVYAAVNLAHGGLKVGFISAELDKTAIYARIWAAATQVANDNHHWAAVGSIESPDSSREIVSGNIMMAANAIQENGGKLLVEDPWGADVDSVINSLRSMKAKNPDLRVAIVDHFHVLARHKGAPTSEAAMLEDRAYKLMSCAKQLEIDLIVLAQMNRVGMDSVGKEQSPTLDQIRGTDALSHVSHAVWIVRKEMVDENGEKKWKGNLEFWHVKTRGRQAVWNGSKVEGVRGFLDKSVLSMDYAYSAVKKGGDMTALLVSRLKEQKR